MSTPLDEKLNHYAVTGQLPEHVYQTLRIFVRSLQQAVKKSGSSIEEMHPLLDSYIDQVRDQCQKPYSFEPFHKKIRQPHDYYAFGLEFLRPMVDFSSSTIQGIEQFDRIAEQLQRKENAILFANHQIEADPQAISLLLEKRHAKIAEEMVFVAGHRVTTDPVAIPFSMGRNLLCIYSKNYIENPPEKKHEKVLHNRLTMRKMGELLNEGGVCIYVAPSGGRDRPNTEGIVQVAPFDPQSIEMFRIVVNHSKQPTHFYPLALSTYKILPPPDSRRTTLGEERITQHGAIHLSIGEEMDLERMVSSQNGDKHEERKERCDKIWQLVHDLYQKLPS